MGPTSSTKRWPSDDFRATGIFGVAKVRTRVAPLTGETQRDSALLTRSVHREQIGFVLWRFGRRSALDAILQHVPPEAPCLIKHILQACLLYIIGIGEARALHALILHDAFALEFLARGLDILRGKPQSPRVSLRVFECVPALCALRAPESKTHLQ